MDNRKGRRRPFGKNGFTMVEVMAALVILIIASQILLLGVRLGAKMEEKADALELARRGIGEHLMEQAECVSGTVHLGMGELCDDLVSDGWLYTGKDAGVPENFEIIWVEAPDFPEVEAKE